MIFCLLHPYSHSSSFYVHYCYDYLRMILLSQLFLMFIVTYILVQRWICHFNKNQLTLYGVLVHMLILLAILMSFHSNFLKIWLYFLWLLEWMRLYFPQYSRALQFKNLIKRFNMYTCLLFKQIPLIALLIITIAVSSWR